MRVIHIVHGRANPEGHNGISRVVYYLNKHEKAIGLQSEIWAVVDDAKTHYTHPRDEHVTVECFPRVHLPFGQREIVDRLLAQKDQIDLVHFHMIWFFDKNIIAKALNDAGIPFIITSHGTYSTPHAWTPKKRLVRWLYERSYLDRAQEIHVLSDVEERGLRAYGYTGPTFLEPNGIAPEEIPEHRSTGYYDSSPYAGRDRLFWIGVKRRDKNLPGLIRAVASLTQDLKDRFVISVFGPDHKGTEAELRALAEELGAGENFEFHGPIYKQEKYDAIESADVFVLPSFTEGTSMAMLDAMACAKPCVLTVGCGCGHLNDEQFFISCEPTPESIADALRELFEHRDDWGRMGENARRVIETRLNWSAIAQAMAGHYQRIAGASA